MYENPIQVLQTSKDSRALQAAALTLARSTQPKDHDALLDYLRRTEFLNRLDSAEDYRAAASKRLRISRVVEALGMNDAPSTRQAIVALTRDTNFLRDDNRVLALIRASAKVRPAPPQLGAFWDHYCQPDDGFSHVTVSVLVENGSEHALEVLEKKMTDHRFEDGDKIAWMRTDVLPHRNDLLLLKSCERMLTGGLSQKLRPSLVEVLFDYQPQEWYTPASIYDPPDRRQASAEAKEVMRRIAQLALKTIHLTERQKQAVEKVLEELGQPS